MENEFWCATSSSSKFVCAHICTHTHTHTYTHITYVGSEGVGAIAASLKLARITELDLGHTGFDIDGARAIATALQVCVYAILFVCVCVCVCARPARPVHKPC